MIPDEQQNIYDPSRGDPKAQISEDDETIISNWAYLPISKALVMFENSDTKPKPIICPLGLNGTRNFKPDLPHDTKIRRQFEIFLYLRNFTDPTKLSVVSHSNLLADLTPLFGEFCDRINPHGLADELLIDDIFPVDKEDNISSAAEKNILLLRLARTEMQSTYKKRTALYKLDCSTGAIYERNKFSGYDPRVPSNWTYRAQITPYK